MVEGGNGGSPDAAAATPGAHPAAAHAPPLPSPAGPSPGHALPPLPRLNPLTSKPPSSDLTHACLPGLSTQRMAGGLQRGRGRGRRGATAHHATAGRGRGRAASRDLDPDLDLDLDPSQPRRPLTPLTPAIVMLAEKLAKEDPETFRMLQDMVRAP